MQAPWTPQTDSDNPLTKIGDMIPKATPVYEGFWKNSDLDILLRLDVASAELKAKRKTKRKPLRSHLPMDRTKLTKLMKKTPTLTGQSLHLY